MTCYFFTIAAALCLFFQKLEAQIQQTKQTPLPPPYSYVENLYLDSNQNFIALGDGISPEKILQPNLNRSYRLLHIPSDQQMSSTAYHQLTSKPLHTLGGTSLILMEYPHNFFLHFFHLLEHLVGAWAFYGHQYADQVQRIIFATVDYAPAPGWQGPNQINEHVLRALFPHAEVKIWSDFIGELQDHSVCFERALVSDRGISIFDPQCGKINKHLGAALPAIKPDTLQSLADRVHAYAHTQRDRTSPTLRVTYLKRPPPRCLTAKLERNLIRRIGQIPSVSLQVKDFATLSFQEQIDTISSTDVLISVHGNGLSHTLFLPKGAAVNELFPPETHHLDYRVFAEARGLDYFGILYKEHRCLDREQAYKIGPYGSPGNPIPLLDIDLIFSVVQSRLKKTP